MQITRNSVETAAGPSEWFTGAVYLDPGRQPVRRIAPDRKQRPLHAGRRTAWHTHPNGQTIYVTEGVGLAQRRGGPIEVIRPGDRVFFEPGRGSLARRCADALHDPHRDARGRRRRQPRDLG